MSAFDRSKISGLDQGLKPFLRNGVGDGGAKIWGGNVSGPLSFVPGLAELTKLFCDQTGTMAESTRLSNRKEYFP
jgi:hypothetical protein